MKIIRKNLRRMRDFLKYMAKFRQRHQMYLVKNNNILEYIEQERVRLEIEQEFAELIKKGAECSQSQNRSTKVWICWFQGEANAPRIVRSCIASVKQNLSNREIIILTEENIPQFIQLPDYIQEKKNIGLISAAHYSDLLRLELLCKYGGMWIDASVLCTSSRFVDKIADLPLFVYKEMDLVRRDVKPILASSWFISAYSNQHILLLTRALLHEYWKTHSNLSNYFLFHICFAIAARRYIADWNAIPMYNNHSPHTMQFELSTAYTPERWSSLVEMSDFHKLNRRADSSAPGCTIFDHIVKTYLHSSSI